MAGSGLESIREVEAILTGSAQLPDKGAGFFALNPATSLAGIAAAGPPSSGSFAVNDVRVDPNGTFWEAVTAGAGGSYASTVLADAPRAYWRLGDLAGTTADSTGKNNRGRPGATVTRGVVGATNDGDLAMTLDGTATGVIVVPGATEFDLGDGPFSIEAWVKRSRSGVTEILVNKGTNGYGVDIAADKIRLGKHNVAAICSSTTTITDTNWHHVVVTKNGSAVKIYIDGIDRTGTVTNATLLDTTFTLGIGQAGGGGTPYFQGSLDEVALYASVLTPTQVTNHFNAGSTLFATFKSATPVAAVTDKGGMVWNVKAYGAKGNGRVVTDGAITSGLAVFTSATAALTSADVGLEVCITGAGTTPSGQPSPQGYRGKILTLNSPTSANMDTSASATVSGAIATIGTDDTDAVQAATYDCIGAGGGTVYRPASSGFYLINSYQNNSTDGYYNLKIGNATAPFMANNVRYLSEGPASRLYVGPGGSVPEAFSFTVNLLVVNTGGFTHDGITLLPFNAVARGDRSITMSTPANAGIFAVGDHIWLRSDTSGAPNGEMNRVVSVNVGTGVVGLKWPTVKPYAATGTYGAGNANSVTATDISLVNEWMIAQNRLLDATGVLGFSILGGYYEMNHTGIITNFNFLRAVTIRDAEFFAQDGQGPGFARSSVDCLIEDCKVTSQANPGNAPNGLVTFGENCARGVVRGCQLSFPGGGTARAIILNQLWGGIIESNWVYQGSGSIANMGAIDDLGSNHDLTIRGNVVEGMAGSFCILGRSDGTVIEDNRVRAYGYGIKAQSSDGTARVWVLTNQVTMFGSALDAFQCGGNLGHNHLFLGNTAIVESGTPNAAILIGNDPASTKSATIIGNFGAGFANGLQLAGPVGNQPGLYVAGNDFSGCTTPYNPTNPMGGVVAITPGASPYTYTAGTTSPEEIYIDGGTVTTVVKNGITLHNFAAAAARCRVHLGPGEQVVTTYTVVPVMNKDRVA